MTSICPLLHDKVIFTIHVTFHVVLAIFSLISVHAVAWFILPKDRREQDNKPVLVNDI